MLVKDVADLKAPCSINLNELSESNTNECKLEQDENAYVCTCVTDAGMFMLVKDVADVKAPSSINLNELSDSNINERKLEQDENA